MKILHERELQQITSNQSTDVKLKDFMKFYKDYTVEPISIIVNNIALPSDNT